MCGLDVTHQAQIMEEDIERVRGIGNQVAAVVADLLDFFLIYHKDPKWGFEGAPLHDPCTIAWLLRPDLFTTKRCHVAIETAGEFTAGMTVVDHYDLTNKTPNTDVVLGVDRQGFVDLLVDRLKFYS